MNYQEQFVSKLWPKWILFAAYSTVLNAKSAPGAIDSMLLVNALNLTICAGDTTRPPMSVSSVILASWWEIAPNARLSANPDVWLGPTTHVNLASKDTTSTISIANKSIRFVRHSTSTLSPASTAIRDTAWSTQFVRSFLLTVLLPVARPLLLKGSVFLVITVHICRMENVWKLIRFAERSIW